MSFSGGVFSINTSGQPVVAGTTISASVFNALTADLATGLSTCILKDGTQTTTAPIPFSGSSNTAASAGTLLVRGGQIGFPATQVPSTDVNTLDDYEEGTWTPGDGSAAGLSFTSALGKYTRIGNVIYYSFQLAYPVTANGLGALIAAFPFTADNTGPDNCPGALQTNGAVAGEMAVVQNTTTAVLQIAATAAQFTNAQLSGLFIRGSGFYFKT